MTIVRVNFRTKLRVTFYPLLYLDEHRHSYILLYRTDRYDYYLTMRSGTIEVVKEGREGQTVKSLVPIQGNLKRAAKVYYRSTLARTEQAAEAIQRILRGQECLLPVSMQVNANGLTRADRLTAQANTVKLSTICARLGLDEKSCRDYLTFHGLRPDGIRWQWPKAKALEIEQLLSSAVE